MGVLAHGAHDEAALEIPARHQLLDVQARHDGLPGARIVGQQEAERLLREHGLVHRGDLVWQRLHLGAVHGQHGIKQVRQPDAVRLGDQAIERAVAIEAPRTAALHHGEARLVLAVQNDLINATVGRAIGDGQRVRAVPIDTYHGDNTVGDNAGDEGVGEELFEGQRGVRQCVGLRAERDYVGTRMGNVRDRSDRSVQQSLQCRARKLT